MRIETQFSTLEADTSDMSMMDKIGKLSPLTCPTCHGSLREMNDEHVLRYRCHTGHAFTAESLTGVRQSGLRSGSRSGSNGDQDCDDQLGTGG